MAGDAGDRLGLLAGRIEASRETDYGFRHIHYWKPAVGCLGVLYRSLRPRAAGHHALWDECQRFSKEQSRNSNGRIRRR